MAAVTFPGLGAPSNFARTVAKPLSRADYRKKPSQAFKNYSAYLNWWQGRNPDWKREYGFFRGRPAQTSVSGTRGPIIERGVRTINGQPVGGNGAAGAGATGTGTSSASSLITALAGETGDPWEKYLRMLDAREKAARDEAIRSRHAQTLDFMAALQGFGGAIKGAAADSWGRVLGGQQQGAANIQGAQNAIADDYTLGLQQANEQIARDFAAVGQSGPANIRDTGAATGQVATVGNERPGEMAGLVGENWRSYAGTVPGNLDFMTEQNLMQAQREGLSAEDEIRNEFAAALADNPQQAMAMWKTVEDLNQAKTTEEREAAKADLDYQIAMSKEKRAQDAQNLLHLKFLADQGKNAWQIARDMTNFSGTQWSVDKKGKPYDTGRPAPGSRAGTAATSATTQANSQGVTQANNLSRQYGTVHIYDPKTGTITNTGVPTEGARHNTALEQQAYDRIGISDAQLKLAQEREQRLQQGARGKGGYSDEQIRLMGQNAMRIANNVYYGRINPKWTAEDETALKKAQAEGKTYTKKQKYLNPIGSPEQALRTMIAAKIPYSIAWNAIYQFAIQADQTHPGWRKALSWNPNYRAPIDRNATRPRDRRESTTGR